jgi:polyisoprenoid-binding protein YceI
MCTAKHECCLIESMSPMNRTRLRAAALLAAVGGAALVGSPAQAAEPNAQSWTVSPNSLFFVKVFKRQGTIASGMAHDHVVRAARFQANLDFDPANPASCKLSLTAPVRDLAVDEPSLRQQVGFKKPIDESDRQKVRESMLDEKQLDAAHYPTIVIEGRQCAPAKGAADQFTVDLAVTIHGRTKRLSTTVQASSQGNELKVRGSFKALHSDFGIKPYSAFLGAVANSEPIEFVANIAARK